MGMGKTHCMGPITLRATCLVPVSDGHFTLCLLVCMGPQASGQTVCITIDANSKLIKKKIKIQTLLYQKYGPASTYLPSAS